MAKLEDLFSASMKQPRKLLDLSKVKIFNDKDFLKYMDRVPELKLRPEKVDPNDVKILTDFTFTAAAARQDAMNSNQKSSKRYVYEDPLPLSMRSTRLEEMWAVEIPWKMLTSDRAPNKLEEGIFERLVDLGRFAASARKLEQAALKAIMSSIIGQPSATYLIAIGFVTSRSKRGAVETRLKTCKNCSLELCTGAFCKLYHYESFTRMIMDKEELENQEKEEMAFLKQVSKSATAEAPAAVASSSAALAKKKLPRKAAIPGMGTSKSKQGRRLKNQIRKTRNKKKKKIKENLEPVSAPDD